MEAAQPFACTLGPADFRKRFEDIAALNARALRRVERSDDFLVLTYDPAVLEEISRIVRMERQCCAFLRFDIQSGHDSFRLVIQAPPEAKDTIPALFDDFLKISRKE